MTWFYFGASAGELTQASMFTAVSATRARLSRALLRSQDGMDEASCRKSFANDCSRSLNDTFCSTRFRRLIIDTLRLHGNGPGTICAIAPRPLGAVGTSP